MKQTVTVFFLIIIVLCAEGQALYSKAFGKSKDQALIFLHGGPGYNAANFESTTAQKLADSGFFVIVYDRRGEGRSIDKNAKFTFQESINDLQSIYKQYDLRTASLIGHSFGGLVATFFAEDNPQMVNAIFLVGAPVCLQATFKNIISRSKKIYEAKKDSANLKYISLLENMDTASLEYSTYSFMHAGQNGFYRTSKPSEASKSIYMKFRNDTALAKYGTQMTQAAPLGFHKNERYTTIDIYPVLKNLLVKNKKIYGLYGQEDGLYSREQVMALESLLGSKNLEYFDNCSHSVFIDQQTLFIDAIKRWL